MKYTLEFQHRNERPSAQINQDGIYYIAFGAEGVHVFQNPTRAEHVVLIIDRGSAFAVFGGEARAVDFGQPQTFGELTLALTHDSSMHPQLAHLARALVHRRRFLAMASAGAALLIVVVAFIIHLRVGGDEQITSAAMETVSADAERRTDTQGNEITALRFKLAKRALDEQQPHKAIEIIDKILAADPANAQARELHDRARDQVKTAKHKNDLKISRDLWAQQMISEASRMMAEGDYVGARFTLRQILDADAANARAIEMMRKIDERLKALTADRASAVQMRAAASADARASFEKGRAFKEAGKTIEAYHAFKKAADALRTHDIHPDYEVLLRENYEETRDGVARQAEALIASARQSYRNGNKNSSSAARAQQYRKALRALHEAEAMYEEVDAKELREGILTGFEDALEPLYVEAITLQELEGCCFANAKLMEIKRLAQFPEVHHYEASVAAMNRCPCRR